MSASSAATSSSTDSTASSSHTAAPTPPTGRPPACWWSRCGRRRYNDTAGTGDGATDMRRGAGLSAGLLAAAWVTVGTADRPPPARLRQPVAAVLLADGRTLAVANRRSGTVALV